MMCEECRQFPCHPSCPNAEQKTVKCAWCGDDVPEYMVQKIGEDNVCGDCETDYLKEKGADFVESFVSEHETDYYLRYWWEGFEDSDKLTMVKKIYEQYYFPDFNNEDRFSDKTAFCFDDDRFTDFIKEGLK